MTNSLRDITNEMREFHSGDLSPESVHARLESWANEIENKVSFDKMIAQKMDFAGGFDYGFDCGQKNPADPRRDEYVLMAWKEYKELP